MAKLFVDYVSDKVIIEELKQYHAYNKALRAGVPKGERPALPPQMNTSPPVAGSLSYSVNSLLLNVAAMMGMTRAQERLARKSIQNDNCSPEPMSCRLHKAYTQLGLACLAQNDVVSAIQSLSYSAKIHPCIHTTTLGLSYSLRNSLLPYAEAEDAIQLYDVIAWRFSGQKMYVPNERGRQ